MGDNGSGAGCDADLLFLALAPEMSTAASERGHPSILIKDSSWKSPVVRFYVNSNKWWDLVINQVPQNALEGHRR